MCHVLIIEDEPMVALLIEEALELEGASTFDIAVTESEAVELAAQNRPSVIMSDVRLIEGTGPRAVEKIREEHGEIPVIFITGTPLECDPCAEGTVLMKPVTVRAVRAAFMKFSEPHFLGTAASASLLDEARKQI